MRRYRIPSYCLWAVVLGICFTIWTAPSLLAQETTTQPDTSQVTLDQVNEVAQEIWCPLCSGVRLDACELKACEQMREVIALKLAEGEDTESIRNYFLAQYGPQVLGEPPREGFNWLAWIIPFVVLAVGGYFLWSTLRNLVRPASEPVAPGPSVQSAAVNPTESPTPETPSTEPPTDEYARKLAEELKRYG